MTNKEENPLEAESDSLQERFGPGYVWLIRGIAVLLLFAGGCAPTNSKDAPARKATKGEKLQIIIKARENPIQIEPCRDLASCVTDNQIKTALSVSLPLWHPPSIPSLVHELKLWGKEAGFTKEQVGGNGRDGQGIVDALLNDSICRKQTVRLGNSDGGAYLIDSHFGIHPIQSGSYDAIEYRGETHFGKIMMIMGLSNVPLSTCVTSASGREGTLADILQDTIMNFNWFQELEFVGCALAYWLPPERSWTNQFGEVFTFDELMEHLLAQPLGKGCCGGTHVPYTVITLLRIDEQTQILSTKTNKKAKNWLKQVSLAIEKSILSNGTLPRDWGMNGQNGFLYGEKVLDNITITGHHLEWIAITPVELRPSDEVIQRLVEGNSKQIELLPEYKYRSFKTLLPCSHAAKAMCMMRGVDPYQQWLKITASKEARRKE